jgi:hypothetical protein
LNSDTIIVIAFGPCTGSYIELRFTQKSSSNMENKHIVSRDSDPIQIQDVTELSLEELSELNGGSWSRVAFGATALSVAAGTAASFPGTWTVPFAGAAMVATSATMGIVAATAGYFAGM